MTEYNFKESPKMQHGQYKKKYGVDKPYAPSEREGKQGRRVDYRETLFAYLHSECDLYKTCEVLKISPATLRGRLANLRKLGVKVPPVRTAPRLPDSLEVAQLNSIVNKWKKDNT